MFASGSPFDMVEVNGQTFYPGQGNNAYVFPGVAFGAILAGMHHIPDAMFLKASQVLLTNACQLLGRFFHSLCFRDLCRHL